MGLENNGNGLSQRALKTAGGGFSTICQNPLEMFVYNESYMDVAVNFFSDTDEYMDLRQHI